MKPLTRDEIQIARHWFERNFPSWHVDRALGPFLEAENRRDWLRQVRIAKQLSVRELNRHVGNFNRFEKAEPTGKITIEALRKCAEALDCELVYAIRPKTKKTFCQLLWDVLLPVVSKSANVMNSNSTGRGRSVAVAMEMLRVNPQFRREQGWCLNRERDAIRSLWKTW